MTKSIPYLGGNAPTRTSNRCESNRVGQENEFSRHHRSTGVRPVDLSKIFTELPPLGTDEILVLQDLALSQRLISVPISAFIERNPVMLDDPLPTRASLLERVKDAGDSASWEEFHRTYRGLLRGVACRAGLDEHEAEEAVQETLIAVAKKMPEFRYVPGKDSFKGWLLQIVRWRIVDQVRRRRGERQAAIDEPASVAERLALMENLELDSVMVPANAADPRQNFDALWEAEWERHVLAQALARVKRQAKPEQYAIYHLHVMEERPVVEVCRTLGVNAAAVYLAKYRVSVLLRKEILRLRKDES